MFPTVSHFIHYIFGVNIPMPFNTFGMLVAMAFIAGYWAFTQEFKRKEQLGVIHPFTKKVRVGEPASLMDICLNGLFGFVIGYKLVFALLNYSAFVNDPQSTLLSTKGNFIGGVILAALFAYWEYKDKEKSKLASPKTIDVTVHPFQLMGNLILWAAIWGFLGAKIFHNLEYWSDFIKDPIEGLLSFSGLTFYGGLICGGAAVLYLARKNGIKPIHMLDIGAPGMMLAYAVGRIGCHVAGDGDWGIPNSAYISDAAGKMLPSTPEKFQEAVHANAQYFTSEFGSLDKVHHLAYKGASWLPDWLFAYNYSHNVIGSGMPMTDCAGKFCHVLPVPVFPTPLYEVIVCLLLFFLMWQLRSRIKLPGMMFGIYMVLNGVERFTVELIRVNSKYTVAGISFTQAEFISSVLFLGGLSLIAYSLKRTKEVYKPLS